jgi:hypothetical protein
MVLVRRQHIQLHGSRDDWQDRHPPRFVVGPMLKRAEQLMKGRSR